MANGELAGVSIGTSGPVSGASVSLYLSSRFGSQPAQGAAAPGGAADYGPITSGTTYGGVGAFTFTSVTEGDYYVLALIASVNYWAGPFSVIENSDVVHQSGNETIAGNKTFTGTIVIGKGTSVTTATSGGSTQSTLDDGSGNLTAAGSVRSNSTTNTTPDLWLGSADSGASSLGTNYGVNRDQNSAIELNAKAGANGGVYTRADGTKKNVLDDGSGNLSAAAGITAGTGFTLTTGSMVLPNASIQPQAINGLGPGFTGASLALSQTFTGQETMDNDVLLKGSQLTGTALGSPAAPTATQHGTTGATTYQYRIVATTYDGRDSIPSSTGQVTNGNATLTPTNNVGLSWSAVSDANTYTVLKFSGGAYKKLAGPISGTTYTDDGSVTPATYTAITVNPGGEISGTTGTFSGAVTAASYGAVTATTVAANANVNSIVSARMLGLVPAGGPAAGTWLTGDYGFDSNGHHWFCTAGGTPGTWVSPYPWGTLGYAAGSGQSGITGLVDQTGSSVTVTVGSGRRIRVSGTCIMSANAVCDVFMYIYEGAATLSESIYGTPSGQYVTHPGSVILKPSAGTHTYKLRVSVDTGATATVSAVSGTPYILVEDIGT